MGQLSGRRLAWLLFDCDSVHSKRSHLSDGATPSLGLLTEEQASDAQSVPQCTVSYVHFHSRSAMATESTPLLQAPHLTDDISNGLSFSARRQSLNAIAAGRQSEFGGPNKGLDDFRAIVARNRLLSRSEQRENITEQVRNIISDEPSLLAMPTSRLDATTYLREAGLLVAWVSALSRRNTFRDSNARMAVMVTPSERRAHPKSSLDSAGTLSWAPLSSA